MSLTTNYCYLCVSTNFVNFSLAKHFRTFEKELLLCWESWTIRNKPNQAQLEMYSLKTFCCLINISSHGKKCYEIDSIYLLTERTEKHLNVGVWITCWRTPAVFPSTNSFDSNSRAVRCMTWISFRRWRHVSVRNAAFIGGFDAKLIKDASYKEYFTK